MRRGLRPKILATYTPWYTPHRIAMPPAAKALADRFAQLAEQIAAARRAPAT
jgi:hypothetical protein